MNQDPKSLCGVLSFQWVMMSASVTMVRLEHFDFLAFSRIDVEANLCRRVISVTALRLSNAGLNLHDCSNQRTAPQALWEMGGKSQWPSIQ